MVKLDVLLVASLLTLGARVASADRITALVSEPPLPTTDDPVVLDVEGFAACPLFWTVNGPVAGVISLSGGGDGHPCPAEPPPLEQRFETRLPLGQLPVGDYRVTVDFAPDATLLFSVRQQPSSLALQPNDFGVPRFYVTARFTDPRDGSTHTAHPMRLTDESGAFWFFGRDNVELTVKILDGTPVNGHWWVFIASMTNVPYEVEIADNRFACSTPTPPGPYCYKSYRSLGGRNENFIDLDFFLGSP
jgi:hypothetical protein